MPIKKAFQPIVELLEANRTKSVSTIMDQITTMCSAKAGGSGGPANFIKNAAGKITHIFCYYHKRWEAVVDCEYGVKANSATGLNTMCKEGTSNWTKAQSVAKKANAGLLTDVASGKVKPGDIIKVQKDIETAKTNVIPRKDGKGTKEMPKSS